MNKQLKNFLSSKENKEAKHERDFNTCYHDKNHWCQNCIAKPQLTSVELPDGTISKGYVLTNFK